jgi:hypothetical protein
MNVIKIRNQKLDQIKKASLGIKYMNPLWINCSIRKVSCEEFFMESILRDHLTITEKPKYQKINYITAGAFCDSCMQCRR